jgi:hypothetical protein
LGYIGISVSSPDRYKALIDVWDMVSKTVSDNGSTPMLMLSAESVVAGTAEILHPDLLGEIDAVIQYNTSSFPPAIIINGNETILTDMTPEARIRFMLEKCREKTGDMTLYPYFTGSMAAEISDAVDIAVEIGYNSYFV